MTGFFIVLFRIRKKQGFIAFQRICCPTFRNEFPVVPILDILVFAAHIHVVDKGAQIIQFLHHY